MNPAAQESLKHLIAKEGLAILDAPERVKDWLGASCPGAAIEQQYLLAALEEKIPQALMQLYDPRILQETLSLRHGFAADDARWAVEGWREALNQALRASSLSLLADDEFTLSCQDLETPPPFPKGERIDSPTGHNEEVSFRQILEEIRAARAGQDEAGKTPQGLSLLLGLLGCVFVLGLTLIFSTSGPTRKFGAFFLCLGGSAYSLCWMTSQSEVKAQQARAKRALEDRVREARNRFPGRADWQELSEDAGYLEETLSRVEEAEREPACPV